MRFSLFRRLTQLKRAALAAWFFPYVMPVLLVAAALVPTLALHPLLERSTFFLFIVAVMVAALLGGLRAGLLATFLSLLVTALVIEPRGLSAAREEWVRIGTFLAVAVWVSAITERTRRDWMRAREQAAELRAMATQRATLLKMAERARSEAEAANRTKDEFLATLSHELRTPLTSIVGWSKMLRSGQLDAETADRAIETIERNARLQTRLIADVLDLSRIVSGKLHLNLVPTEVLPVVETAVDTIRPAAEAKHISVRRVLDPFPCPVLGDSDRLQQIVWNLLANAIKFTPPGGAVDVRLACRDKEAEIVVSDTGVGMSPELLPHVFERFRQGDASSTRRYGGLGLGLAIVRHLVELHGGRVEAQSGGLGRGATFRVLLPRLLEAEAVAHANHVWERRRNENQGLRHGRTTALQGLKVLVVDDEPDARELLSTILEHDGADVVAADSAAQALSLLDRAHPDVLLSDLEMPGESGYVLIGKVRQRPPEHGGRIPAAAITAYARIEDRTRALRAGFQMHVPKPLNPTELVTVVASLAGRQGEAATPEMSAKLT